MIKTKVSRETNYIYHMLSVSKCGYDNDYGCSRAGYHSEADLQVLKSNETHISVKGGEHCGKLYWPLVALPASLDTPAKDFYAAVRRYYQYGDEGIFILSKRFVACVEQCKELAPVIIEICGVMERNYDIYMSQIWGHSRAELHEYAEYMQRIFDGHRTAEKIEGLIGQKLNTDFIATFCNSLDYGPEAIDISENQDVFGLGKTCGRTYEIAKSFILHEYTIYLLKQALSGTGAFDSFIENWPFTEALAEFYLSKAGEKTVMGGILRSDIIDFYCAQHDKNPELSAAELFTKAKTAELC